MKKILLSFQPYWVEKIMNGDKIYEYRKRFCNEPVIAYMYVSAPVKAVTGIVHLGKKTKLSDWREQYKNNSDIVERIDDFMTRNNIVMPIEKVIPTSAVTLDELRSNIPGFKAPQMYYDLDANPALLNFIEKNIRILPGKFENNFLVDTSRKVCEKL